jgi:hypothetical protein
MTRDRDYFRRKAAEARSACLKDDGEGAEVAGQLALAYAALARRRGAPPKPDAPDAVDHAAASVADDNPLMLHD